MGLRQLLSGNSSKSSPRKRKKLSPEQMSQKLENDQKRFINEALINRAQKDPEIMDQLIAKQHGIEFPKETEEQRIQGEIRTTMARATQAHMEAHPEMLEAYFPGLMARYLGQEIPPPNGDDDDYDGNGYISPTRQLIEQLDDIDELNERLGNSKEKESNSFLNNLFNSEFGKALGAGLLAAFMAGKGQQLPQQQYEPVEYPQIETGDPSTNLVQTGESQPRPHSVVSYQPKPKPIHIQQEQPTPVPVETSNHKDEPVTTSSAQVSMQEDEEQPQTVSLGMAGWGEFVDKPASEFVDHLLYQQSLGDIQCQFILDWLKDSDLESVLGFLDIQSANPEYYNSCMVIKEHPDWIEEVIALVKEVYGGE